MKSREIFWALVARTYQGILGLVDHRISRILNIVRENVAVTFSVWRLAELSGLSVSRFCHLFRSETRLTPRGYVECVRMEFVLGLVMKGDMAIKEIAFAAGYAHERHFIRAFKRHFGVSPGEYRRAVWNGAPRVNATGSAQS